MIKVSHKTSSFSSHFPFPTLYPRGPKPKESNKHNRRRRVETMLSLYYYSSCSFSSSSKLFQTSPSLFSFSSRNPRIHSKFLRTFTAIPAAPNSDEGQQSLAGRRANYGGVNLEETVDINSGKLRLDSWISSRITGISRARVQSSIRSGLVSVNGRIVDKVFFNSLLLLLFL